MALTDKLTVIADAIRAKTGGTEALTLDQMAVEIEGIETGGGNNGLIIADLTFASTIATRTALGTFPEIVGKTVFSIELRRVDAEFNFATDGAGMLGYFLAYDNCPYGKYSALWRNYNGGNNLAVSVYDCFDVDTDGTVYYTPPTANNNALPGDYKLVVVYYGG